MRKRAATRSAKGVGYKAQFMRLTYSRYRDMKKRIWDKYQVELSDYLTVDQLRLALYKASVGTISQGHDTPHAFKCPWCQVVIALDEVAIDHREPLSRGGYFGAINLQFICKPCNDLKGGLSPKGFADLRIYLKTMHPMDQQEVEHRLRIAVQLAAGASYRRKKARVAK